MVTISQLRAQLTHPGSGRLVIVSAPSGAGKSTIVQGVLGREDGRVIQSISCTTRPPRPGERNDLDYQFITPDRFTQLEAAGAFLEASGVVNGHRYGTLSEPLLAPLKAGIDVLLVIEVNGAHAVRQRVPEAISMFIMPAGAALGEQLAQLERQLRIRQQVTGESDASIAGRLELARTELPQAAIYDYRITNVSGQPERAITELVDILRRTRKTPR